MTTSNKGYETEQNHYSQLQEAFENFKVSDPKGAAVGSDFQLLHPEIGMITIESKTSNTDLFDAGVLTAWSNGCIQSLSSFYSDEQKFSIQTALNENVQQIQQHLEMANADTTSYVTTKPIYESIREAGKLINIYADVPKGLVHTTLTKSGNDVPKSHYVIVGDLIYRSSHQLELDPLHLAELGVPYLGDDDVKAFDIKSRRGGSSGPEKKVRVTVRMGYKFSRILPATPLKLDNLKQIVQQQLRKHY